MRIRCLLILCVYATTIVVDVACKNLTYAWKFSPGVKDASKGYLYITLNNPSAEHQEYSQSLDCFSLEILQHDRTHVKIPAGEERVVSYKLGIIKAYMKENPDQFEHTCVYYNWLKKTNQKNAEIKTTIRTYPGYTFVQKCTSYDGNDLIVETSKNEFSSKTITLTHEGSLTHYIANISCEPNINLLLHGNMYNYLRNNKSWTIPLTPNCSNVLDIDYSGDCRLTIYQFCQEKTLLKEIAYPYYEGDVDECAHVVVKDGVNEEIVIENSLLEVTGLIALFLLLMAIFVPGLKFAILSSKYGLHDGRVMMENHIVDAFWLCCRKKFEYEPMIYDGK